MTMRFKVLDSVKLRIGAVVSQFEFSFF